MTESHAVATEPDEQLWLSLSAPTVESRREDLGPTGGRPVLEVTYGNFKEVTYNLLYIHVTLESPLEL